MTRPGLQSVRLGAVVASAFVLAATIAITGAFTPGYHPLVDAVSRLGSHDEPFAWPCASGWCSTDCWCSRAPGPPPRRAGQGTAARVLMVASALRRSWPALHPRSPGGTHTLMSRITSTPTSSAGRCCSGDGPRCGRRAPVCRSSHRIVRGHAHDTRRHRLSVHLGVAPYGLIEISLLTLRRDGSSLSLCARVHSTVIRS